MAINRQSNPRFISVDHRLSRITLTERTFLSNRPNLALVPVHFDPEGTMVEAMKILPFHALLRPRHRGGILEQVKLSHRHPDSRVIVDCWCCG